MKTIIVAALLFSVQFMPAVAADPAGEPGYVGQQTGNPETDTYAFRPSEQEARRLAFVGPASRIGTQTGDPEKDTWGYQPVLVDRVAKAN